MRANKAIEQSKIIR